MLFDFLGVVYY